MIDRLVWVQICKCELSKQCSNLDRNTYGSIMQSERPKMWIFLKNKAALFWSKVLQRCGLNVWIRRDVDVIDAFATIHIKHMHRSSQICKAGTFSDPFLIFEKCHTQSINNLWACLQIFETEMIIPKVASKESSVKLLWRQHRYSMLER